MDFLSQIEHNGSHIQRKLGIAMANGNLIDLTTNDTNLKESNENSSDNWFCSLGRFTIVQCNKHPIHEMML